MDLTVNPKRLMALVLVAVAVLLLAHGATLVSRFALAHDYVFGLVPLLDFFGEGNLPTWFTSVLLFGGALVAGTIRAVEGRRGGHHLAAWTWLALLLCFLSIDEVAMIHERLGDELLARGGFEPKGAFTYLWTAPALAVVLVLGMAFARFLLAIPRRTAFLLLAGGVVYLGGALGLEMVEGAYIDANPALVGKEAGDLGYELMVTVEELMEMLGASLVLYACVDHLARLAPFTIWHGPAPPDT